VVVNRGQGQETGRAYSLTREVAKVLRDIACLLLLSARRYMRVRYQSCAVSRLVCQHLAIFDDYTYSHAFISYGIM